MVRYPKGKVGPEVVAIERLYDGVDVLARNEHDMPEDGVEPQTDVLIVSVGAMSEMSLDVARRIGAQGISSTVVDPRWVMPVPRSVVQLASQHRIVIVVEDGVRTGGVGARIRQELRAAGIDTALNEVGLPVEFLSHGTRAEVMERVGLTAQRVAQDTVEQVIGTRVPCARPLPGHPAPRTGQMPSL